MKRFVMKTALTTATVAVFAFGATTITRAQDQKPEDKPPAQEQKEAKPAPPPKEARPAHQQPSQTKENQANDKQAQPDSKSAQDEAKQAQQQAKQAQDSAKRAQKEDSKHSRDNARIAQSQQPREPDQRSASSGADQHRIPDDKFSAHFGHEHHFHVGHPVIVDNRSRFQYSGYWFEFIDPWPVGWSYDDDCYIDYVDDGYNLFDPVHPGVRIAITLVM